MIVLHVYPYTVNPSVTLGLVATGELQMDAAAPYTAVTRLRLASIDDQIDDVHAELLTVPAGAALRLEDPQNTKNRYLEVTTTGAPVDGTTYVDLPVAYGAAGPQALDDLAVHVIVAMETAAPVPGPSLVTLAEAKTHLRVTTDAQDADIQAKADQASAIVLDYLKGRADEAWTDATVPRPVKAGVLLMLTHLYEHRGDDPATDADLWDAIGRLLVRFRDPALA